MFLYLVQHALSRSKKEDPERGITDTGRLETAKTGNALAETKPEIHFIWHSGKKRAFETAEILSVQLGIPDRVKEHKDLGPNDPVQHIKAELERTEQNIMIIGHLPYLSRLLSSLICDQNKDVILKFNNSGIVCLEKIENKWSIVWAIIPDILK